MVAVGCRWEATSYGVTFLVSGFYIASETLAFLRSKRLASTKWEVKAVISLATVGMFSAIGFDKANSAIGDGFKGLTKNDKLIGAVANNAMGITVGTTNGIMDAAVDKALDNYFFPNFDPHTMAGFGNNPHCTSDCPSKNSRHK